MSEVDLGSKDVQRSSPAFESGQIFYYRAKMGRKDRVCIFAPINDSGIQVVTKIVQHYSNATGKYARCIGAGCPGCAAGVPASDKYCVNLLVYPTDKDGKIVGPMEPAVFGDGVTAKAISTAPSMVQIPGLVSPGLFMALWQFGPDKFVNVRENRDMLAPRSFKGMEVKDIRTRDQFIICNREDVQDLLIQQIEGPATWMTTAEKDPSFSEKFKLIKEQMVDTTKYYSKLPTAQEVAQLLGVSTNVARPSSAPPKAESSFEDMLSGDSDGSASGSSADGSKMDIDDILNDI